MSRAALIELIALLTLTAGFAAAAKELNPHVDPTVVPGGCMTCHEGHGASRSPMLPVPQKAVCLECHGTQLNRDRMIERGLLAAEARPQLLARTLAELHVHPLTDGAFSRYQERVVTCTSCHSPHRGILIPGAESGAVGLPRPSPRNPGRFEYELCESCHGSAGAATQSLTDISRLFNSTNRSYHPVEAPATESSLSVMPDLAGREINCTDCHNSSRTSGPRGPHGSEIAYILAATYAVGDGVEESGNTYRLCYRCHGRDLVLEQSPFPLHRMHVVDERLSCASCHNPHGSVKNRALIRFGEETRIGGVAPSGSGRLGFESDASGSGACYLICHGHDHDPETYDLGSDLPLPWSRPPRIDGVMR